jgi:DNA helicase HerA-like ATPase
MRVTNPYDLDHIKATSEALSKEAMRIINTLPTGNALIMGAALNFPIFVQIRERKMPNIRGERTLTDICKEFTNKDPIVKNNTEIKNQPNMLIADNSTAESNLSENSEISCDTDLVSNESENGTD